MARPAGTAVTTPPVALTIAGSDSGAGAGIQADLKAMSALGVFATTVVTAVTAQNTAGVTAVHPVPTEMVGAQLDAVLDDFDVRSVKTGMLATTATVRLVADRAAAGDLPCTGGRPGDGGLDRTTAPRRRRRGRLPRPARPAGPPAHPQPLRGGDPGRRGADRGRRRRRHGRPGRPGPRPRPDLGAGQGWAPPGVHASGHGPRPDRVADVLFDGTDVTVLEQDRVDTRNNHGTGCSLASATAALLATGPDVPAAVGQAKVFVHGALVGAAGWHLGRGHGPLGSLRLVPGLTRPPGWAHRPDGRDRGRALRPGLWLPPESPVL